MIIKSCWCQLLSYSQESHQSRGGAKKHFEQFCLHFVSFNFSSFHKGDFPLSLLLFRLNPSHYSLLPWKSFTQVFFKVIEPFNVIVVSLSSISFMLEPLKDLWLKKLYNVIISVAIVGKKKRRYASLRCVCIHGLRHNKDPRSSWLMVITL